MLAVFSMLRLYFPIIIENLDGTLFKFLGYASVYTTVTSAFAMQILRDSVLLLAVAILPVMLVSAMSSVVATGAQTRFLFAPDNLKPKFSRLNPISGLKNLFAMRSFVEVLKSILKIIIIVYIVYNFFIDKLPDFARTLSLDISQSVSMMLSFVIELVYNVCIIFAFIAALDFLYQWWDYERQLRMSKQEVKEEYKQMEGDPKIKAQIKERQRKISMSRMMQAVPTADVIIRNPTHYAVALKYDLENGEAPVVVAKGANEIALRIVKVGLEHDVVVMENPELTRAIYAAADVNDQIPFEFYQAVAELLAYVYKIKDRRI